MKIKVISLSLSIERRDSIEKQLREVGTAFEFSDAITPQDALKHVHHYDEREFVMNCGRGATAPEIACYASHLALWQQCASGNDPYLILEDDAELDEFFIAGLSVLARQISKRGLIRASVPAVRDSLTVDKCGQFEIQYCRRAPLLALGYAVSPKGAGRLAGKAAIVQEPVDKYMQRFWRHRQPVYAMRPAIVRHAPIAEKSDIGERIRPACGLATWIKRAKRKTANSIARARFNHVYGANVGHVD